MTDLVERLARLFVEPADVDHPGARRVAAAAAAMHPPVGMLLCEPAHAEAFACAAALDLRAAARCGAALACVWTGEDARPAPHPRIATSAARRLAAKLRARGLDAHAAGRLTILSLPADGAEAAHATHDAIAASRAPAAVALAGARCEATDCLLFSADAVTVLTPGSGALAALAAETLPVPGEPVAEVRPGAVARVLARSGLAVTPSLRRGLRGEVSR